jgi:hypothetical protein
MPLEPGEGQCLYCGEPAGAGGKRGAPPPEAGEEEAESNPVSIATFETVEEAEACKAKLDAAGVASMVDAGGSGAEWGQFNNGGSRSVQLWVRENDAQQAMNILQGEFEGNGHPEGNHAVVEPEAEVAEEVEQVEEVEGESPHDDSGKFHADAPPHDYDAESIRGGGGPPRDDLRTLESRLSALMDDHDTPGWDVNPAHHPEVEAFIEEHSNNAMFVKKARALQENRASYYEAMKGRETSDAEAADMAEAEMAEEEVPAGQFGEDVPDVGTLRGGGRGNVKGLPKKRSMVSTLLIVLLLVPAVVAGGYIGYTQLMGGGTPTPPGPGPGPGPGPVATVSGEPMLTKAVSDTDAKGPWKWAELPAQRAEVPAASNAATKVTTLTESFDKGKIKPVRPAAPFLAQEPWVPLGIGDGKKTKDSLAKSSLAIVRAMNTATPEAKGRYPDRSFEDALTKPAYLAKAQSARDVLLLEAARKAQPPLKQGTEALIPIRIAMGIGRSVGDDPELAAQQFRVETRHLVVQSLERLLRWSQPSADSLTATQKLLQNEVSQPLLTYAARGQRALVHEALTKIEGANGAAHPALVAFLVGGENIPAEQWKDAEWLKANHAVILEQLAALAELEAVPQAERPGKLQEVEAKVAELANAPDRNLARLVLAPIAAFTRSYLTSQAELETAITALASERFRIDAGRFPLAPGQLVQAKLLDKDPVDPLDGNAIKIVPFDNKGSKIYSVGPDGKDDSGAADRGAPGKTGTDAVFRLWAPAARVPGTK